MLGVSALTSIMVALAPVSSVTVKNLRDMCAPHSLGCASYIAGFLDGYAIGGVDVADDIMQELVAVDWDRPFVLSPELECVPKTVSFEQLGDMFIQYTEAYPDKWQDPARVGLFNALLSAFPCTPGQPPPEPQE